MPPHPSAREYAARGIKAEKQPPAFVFTMGVVVGMIVMHLSWLVAQ